MTQLSNKYDLEERTAVFGENIIKCGKINLWKKSSINGIRRKNKQI